MHRGRPRGRRGLLGSLLMTVAALALAMAPLACGARSEPPETFHGVRLGMTPGDVRERFRGPKGVWHAVPGNATVLDYAPDSGGAPKVRFEFHSGMLVAVRAVLDGGDLSARGAPRAISPGSVLVREQGPRGKEVLLTWLSRDCPTHKDEAARLAR